MEELWGITELIRYGYFENEQLIRKRIRQRKFPTPLYVGRRMKWKAQTVKDWVTNGTICWIPRTGGDKS